MKILRLDLRAFGPFSGVSIAPGDGEYGLHVVYGPNEAGKSSSLRALRQWLYGIPHNSNDNFIHPHPHLRIGGVLETTAGDRFEFIRRKGRNKTLRGPDDNKVVEEARLAELLQGVDGEEFSRRFAIDYEELRKGGEAIVRGGGDLAQTLFAAGSGIADLGLVQKRLDDEVDELFRKNGQKQRINRALSDWHDARRKVKEALLPTDQWKQLNEDLEAARKDHEQIKGQLLEKRTEANRLERFERALPLIGQRQSQLDQLAELADVPLLPEDFSQNRSRAVADLASATKSEQEAEKELERLQALLDDLTVASGLLEHRTAISRLHTQLGSYTKAAQDHPKLAARMSDLERQAQGILRDLGREADLSQAEALRLSRVRRERIQSLARQFAGHLEKQGTAQRSAKRLRDQIAAIDSQHSSLPDQQDVGELKRAIRRAQKHGDLEQQLAGSLGELSRLEQQAQVDLDSLPLWDGPLQALERLAVPSLETVERFENEINDSIRAVESAEERITDLKQQARGIDQKLEQFRLEHDVPSEGDLLRARQRRDEGWKLIEQLWRGGSSERDESVVAFLAEFAPAGDLAQAFQASIEAADALADRLRREADRVAEKAKLTADRQSVSEQISELHETLRSARQKQEQVQASWCSLWTAASFEPLPPREMRSWLRHQQSLVDLAEQIRSRRSAVEATEELLRSLQEQLKQSLPPLARSSVACEEGLSAAVERCEDLVEELEETDRQRLILERQLGQLRSELAEAEAECEQARSELEHWRGEWAEAVESIGLEPGADPSAANSVIESVDELMALLEAAKDLQSRLDGIAADAAVFEQALRSLLEQIAPDLLELPVERAVADLSDRLEAAVTAKTKRDEWTRQFTAEEKRREAARAEIERLKGELATMCRQAGCDAVDQLPDVERRSAQRRELEREVRRLDQQLGSESAAAPLEEFVAEAQRYEQDQVRAELKTLREEIEQLDGEKSRIAQNIGGLEVELRRMDGGDRAAEVQEQAEYLLAGIRSDAEEYVRLKLASVLLRNSIERYRDLSQGPVLERTGRLFAALTLGSFAGVRAEYGEKGNVLMGVRASDGRTVSVEGMSDGTCDQLYLALRLALLESSLERGEPLPFIIDDVLIMFDDARAAAALKVLADLSARTQVIFFTHHEHVLELARQHVEPSVLFVHRLSFQQGNN